MPRRAFIVVFPRMDSLSFRRAAPGFSHHVQLRNQRPGDGTDTIGIAGIVTVRIAVAVDVGEIGCRDDVQRLPSVLLFGLGSLRRSSFLRSGFEPLCVRLPQVLDVGHQLVDFQHNARVLVEICRDGFGDIL